MAANSQGFPIITQAIADLRTGQVTQAWQQFFASLWARSGGSTGAITVNPGTGNNSRPLDDALADYANVNDYLNQGETSYDGAFARALADKNKVYVPAKPWVADPNNFYHVTDTILLSSGQEIRGDGAGVTRLVCDSPDKPVITLGSEIYWFVLRDMTIAHSVPATAGGDGIYQGQGLTDWVDNCLMSNLYVVQNYHGLNLGKAFSGHVRDVYANGNVERGFNFITTGNSDVGGVAYGGPMQWVLINCAAQANGDDGYHFGCTGTAHGGYGVGSSLGTLINCVTYANGHHGMSFEGSAAQPLHAARIDGGFIGEDAGQGIYLDTYGSNHVVAPQYIELSGQNNILLTANNNQTTIMVQNCGGAWLDGINSQGATDTVITGGLFVNNGRAGSLGIGATWAGIRIDGGSATINAVRSKDTGSGLQSYGISVDGDDVLIDGCRLTDNAIAPIVWASGPTNSIVTGCLPASVNTGLGGDVQFNSIGVGMAPSGVAGELRTAGAVGFNGGLTVTAGGITTSPGAIGITTDNLTVNHSAGVGTPASGTTGHLRVNGSSQINSLGVGVSATGVSGQFRANGASSFSSGLTISAGGLTVTGGLTVDNAHVTTSMGVGAIGASGVTGELRANNVRFNSIGIGGAASGTAGRLDAGNVVSTSGTFSGSVQISSLGVGLSATGVSGQFRANGASSFSGGLTISSGGLSLTGGLTVDNVALSGSFYATTATGGPMGAGTINVKNAYNDASLYNNP